MQYRLRVQAFWACASGRCLVTVSNLSGSLHNATLQRRKVPATVTSAPRVAGG